MTALTRAQITGRARSRIGEVKGKPSWGDPEGWNDFLDETADDLARSTDCYYTSFSADFVSGKAKYCAPPVYKIKAILVYDLAGTEYTIPSITPVEMDRLYGNVWRGASPEQGVPRYAVIGGPSGTSEVSFYPVPNYTTASNSGFVFEGYAVPAQSWPADGSACPLPDRAHMAVVYGAALRRAYQFHEEYAAHIPQLEQQYARLKGQLEAETATLDEAGRHADQCRIGGYFGGGYS